MILTKEQKDAFKDVLGVDDAKSHVDEYTMAYVNHIVEKAKAEVGLKKCNRIKAECSSTDIDGMISVLDARIIEKAELVDIKETIKGV